MKEQTSAYLDKTRELLDQAETMLEDLNEAAGRTAYLAGFHAAQALIFENSGRVYKTHGGSQGEFSRVAKDDARVNVAAAKKGARLIASATHPRRTVRPAGDRRRGSARTRS